MKPMGNARAHFLRTLKMAKAADVPLARALDDGVLSQSDYAEAITLCRRCPHPVQCEAMLVSVEKLREVPDFCANRAVLEALKGEMG